MYIKFNIPVLQEEEIWRRNQQFKNWGNYIPLAFNHGKPSYLIPNYQFLATQALLNLLLATLLLYDFASHFSNKFQLLLARLIMLMTNLFLLRLIIKTDPGISSRGDPIINQEELSGYKNFCTECKCMQTESIRHCNRCNVCIQGCYAHLNITKMCITQKNYLPFVLFCVSMIVQIVLIL